MKRKWVVVTISVPYLKWTLQWRCNERNGVSNHQPHDCLLNRLFRHRSKKTSKLRVTGLCEGNSPVTGEFPAQSASNAVTRKIIPFDDVIMFRDTDYYMKHKDQHAMMHSIIAILNISDIVRIMPVNHHKVALLLTLDITLHYITRHYIQHGNNQYKSI